LKEQHPGAPHLVFALSNAPAAPFQFVAAPSEDLQRMLEDRMPQIPAPIEMPMTTVTRGIASAVLTGQLPPNGSARLVVQATDAQAAGQLKTVADKYLAFLTSPLLQQVMPDVDFQKIAATLTPQMKEDQLVLAWDDAQAGSAVKPFSKYVVMQLTRARLAATRVQSASNMRLISLAIINYAQRNQGNLPDKLEQLEKAIPPQVLIDPRGGAAQPDYIYHKPAETINQVKTPGETILVYENPDDVTTDSIINMAFADGHIDAVPRERAIQMIKALDAAVPQK
jgi:prepilin-type processing-associated H-X9-DG protein